MPKRTNVNVSLEQGEGGVSLPRRHHHHDGEGASAKPGIRGYQHESSLDRAAYQGGKPYCNEMMMIAIISNIIMIIIIMIIIIL